MVTLLVVLIATGRVAAPVPAQPDDVSVQIRMYAADGVDVLLLRRAREVAARLLAAAGLVVAWQTCAGSSACQADAGPVPAIVVSLTQDRRTSCGIARRGATPPSGSILVSVPCVADKAFAISRGAGRRHPYLVMPRHDDVVGAIVAHEIGHLFGLSHAANGLMRQALEPGDIVALRMGELRFSTQEAARMAVAAGAGARSARNGASAAAP
jgi:hypothetical protein